MAEEPCLAVAGHAGAHGIGGVAADGRDDWHRRVDPPTEKIADSLSCGFAMRVPAGDIDGGLCRRMAGQNGVHGILNAVVAARVKADHRRGQQGKGASHPVTMGRDIGASKGCALSPSDCAVIAMQRDNGGVERTVFAPSRQAVDTTRIGKLYLMNIYPRDLHEYTMTGLPMLSRSGSTPRPGASPG